jgi:hypothetical protein
MSRAVYRPTEHKADETLDDHGDERIVGDNRSRADHEQHRRRIDGAAHDVFIGEGTE